MSRVKSALLPPEIRQSPAEKEPAGIEVAAAALGADGPPKDASGAAQLITKVESTSRGSGEYFI